MRWQSIFVFLLLFYIVTADTALMCDDGYSGPHSSTMCYREFDSPLLNYDDARAFCQSQGGDLASIHNAFENSFIKSFNDDGAYIGLRFSESHNAFMWSDGTPLDYTNYVDDFGANIDFHRYCTRFRSASGKWDNLECGDLSKYICEKPAVERPVTPNNVCPNSSILYKDGGVLLSPGYPNDYVAGLDCVYNLAAKNGYFIKLFLDGLEFVYYMDWFDVTNNHDKDTWNVQLYTADTRGYEVTIPNNRARIDFHSRGAGKWKLSWIQLKGLLTVPAFPLQDVVISNADERFMCPSGYSVTSGECYRLVSDKKLSYLEAVNYCRNEGADLASIHDENANAFLQQMIHSGEDALIGLLYVGKDAYQWSDETALDYAHYAEGFVSNRDYLGYCARLMNGEWRNAECADRLNFFCGRKATSYNTTTPNDLCPDRAAVYENKGLILSPGYPEKYADSLPDCRYELLAKSGHYIKIVMEEADYMYETFMAVHYYSNGKWLWSAVPGFYLNSDGDEVIIPHNHIVIEFMNRSHDGRYRIKWTEIEQPSI